MAGTAGRSGGNRKKIGVDRTKKDGLPVCPKTASAAIKRKWKELLGQLENSILRGVDCHQLFVLCQLLDSVDVLAERLRQDPLDDRARRLLVQTAASINRLSVQFGLSPLDRKRLDAEPEREPSAFDDWLKRAGGAV